jgi:hypothetical protein
VSGRKGDARPMPLMTRYAVQPLGDGAYGVYDRSRQAWVQTFRGRGAMQRANRKWRSLVGAS